MELEDIIDRWHLSKPIKIATTHTSDVYKVVFDNQVCVLKALNAKGQIYEKNGHIALSAFSGSGCINLIQKMDRFLLLEYASGQKLSSVVNGGSDHKASEIIVEVLRKIHSSDLPTNAKLPDLERQFKSLIVRGQEEPRGSLLYKSLLVAEELIASQESVVLLHGDIHHDNILFSSSRGWLAIDPQPLIGEKSYDFANCFFNPDNCPSLVETAQRLKDMASAFSKATEIDPHRLLKFAFAHGGLSMSWQLDEGQAPERRLRISKLLENLLGL